MEEHIWVTDQIAVGSQPATTDIRRLAERGFKSIINVREDGEQDQPLGSLEEHEQAVEVGLAYLNVPISDAHLSSEVVDLFRQKLADTPKPVLVHSGGGERAGAMVMTELGVRMALNAEDVVPKAKELGLKCSDEELWEFVRNYVDIHHA